MKNLVRDSLSNSLYGYFNKGSDSLVYQVPFVDQDGVALFDEEMDYVNIVVLTKELLENGASPLYYIYEKENFLVVYILSKLSMSGFSLETKREIPHLLVNHVSEKELSGLLPEHGNKLLKQLSGYQQTYPYILNGLIAKGLKFRNDVDSRYGNEPVEIEELRNGNYYFFQMLIEHSMQFKFDMVYKNGLTFNQEMEKLKEKIRISNSSDDDSFKDSRQSKRLDIFQKELEKNIDKTIRLLEKWKLKKSLDNLSNTKEKIKATKI